MYNNPALQMVMMATVDRYWPNAPADNGSWPTGEDKMLVVSVGTGTSPAAHDRLDPDEMNLLLLAVLRPVAERRDAAHPHPLLFRGGDLVTDALAVTSRSNCAKDSRMFKVKRPIDVVVLNCCVTETKDAPLASRISTILANQPASG
jgi:hypothetical protein